MSDARANRSEALRRMREVAFALGTGWLFVQNAVLLLLLFGAQDAAARGLVAVGRAVLTAIAPLWAIAVLVAIGGLAAATLASREAKREWEAEHGHAQ